MKNAELAGYVVGLAVMMLVSLFGEQGTLQILVVLPALIIPVAIVLGGAGDGGDTTPLWFGIGALGGTGLWLLTLGVLMGGMWSAVLGVSNLLLALVSRKIFAHVR